MDARREPVTRTIGGITFEDPYAWLQPDTEEVLAWQAEQDRRAAAAVRDLPGFDALLEAVRAHVPDVLAGAFGPGVQVAGRWFRIGMNAAGTAQAVLVADDRDGPGRFLVDAAELTAAREDGRPVAIFFATPSPDGRFVAYSESAGGDMTGVYRVVEVDSGRLLDVEVPILIFNTPKPGWLPDGSGFFLQDRTEDGRHALRFVAVTADAPAVEAPTFTFEQVPATLPGLVPQVSPGGRRVVAVTVPHEHLAAVVGDLQTGVWRRFAPEGFEGELHGGWLDDDTYVAIATDAPRGRVVAIPAATSTDPSTWRELVPAGDRVLRALQVVRGRIVLSALRDVSLDVTVHEPDGTLVGRADLPPHSASMALVGPPRVKDPSDAFIFAASTFTTRGATYELDVADASLTPITEPEAALEGIAVEQRFATSADGTPVPYYVVAREEVLPVDGQVTGPRPTLVHAYGGFNLPLLPDWLRHVTPFVQAGGVYVHANLRGGGEYGREWYEAGRRHEKWHTFEDLRAVAEDLIARGAASPETLAFHGGSNGGLLAGVAAVHQPELWRAVVPQVPLFDMLELTGDVPGVEAIRSYYLEDYGDPDDPVDAKVLHSYSPYHHVREGVAYPAVFQVFGEKDLGCQPFHGRKLTAALQHATTSGHPVLLRVWGDVGHGSLDSDLQAQQAAEWLAFVMDQLGMPLDGG